MCNSGRIGNRPCLPATVVGAPPAAPARLGKRFSDSGRIGNRFSDSGRIGSPCPPIFNFRQNRQCPSLAPCPSVRFVPSVVKSPLSAESATPIRQFSISGRIGNRLLHSGRIGNRLPLPLPALASH